MSPPPQNVRLRDARPDDVAAIASLHADSWRRHYRGALTDDYLEHQADDDRLTVWTARFADPQRTTTTITVIASPADPTDPTVLGFAHTLLGADPTWGALLDNLHVTAASKRSGIGTMLLAETARRVLERDRTSGLWLWVLEQNVAAQAFYLARGGRFEDHQAKPQPGGSTAVAIRCVWPEPTGLLM
jgi:ribosomal protein S18 acetylase RimI-like enzyme